MWIFIPVFFSFSECYVKTILPEGIVNIYSRPLLLHRK